MDSFFLCVGRGARSTDLVRTEFTFSSLVDWLSNPPVGEKDGEYFIRGGDALTRSNDSLKSGEFLVIDADHGFDPRTGEECGSPGPGLAHAALTSLNIAHIIYTTNSNDPDANTTKPGWRYRILIPAKMRREDLVDCVDYVLELLHAKNVPIGHVKENYGWAQAWYTPRLRPDDKNFCVFSLEDGEPLNVRAALVAGDDRRRAQKAINDWKPVKPVSVREGNTIEAFNKSATPEWVCQYLEGHGYQFVYKRDNTFRYMRPGSESGTAGVVVFQGKFGDWCTYSHHGGADPLSGKVCDPFGLVATFEFGGNVREAALAMRNRKAAEPPPRPMPEVVQEVEPLTVDEPPPPPAEARKPEQKPRVRLVRADELTKVKVPWLVHRLIPANSFAILYGKPGTYKSFIAMYLSAHVATGGTVFSGRITTKGDVVYIAAEGRGGLHQRWAALRDHYDFPIDTPLYFVEASLDLRESDQDYVDLVAAIKSRSNNPRMIVVDTLARTFGGGDENDASEMSQFINTQSALQQEFGCAVLAIHHSGKDEARGMRGSSALLGAADVVLFLSRDVEAAGGTVLVQKMKDGEDGVQEKFAVTPWVDPNDPETTSLVVEYREPSPSTLTLDGDRDGAALEVLRSEIGRIGKGIQDPVIADWGVKAINVKEWQEAYVLHSIANGLNEESSKRYFRESKKRLSDSNRVKIYNKIVWINGA